MDERRGSKIPKFAAAPAPVGGPLSERATNIDRKRKGGVLEDIVEGKRQTTVTAKIYTKPPLPSFSSQTLSSGMPSGFTFTAGENKPIDNLESFEEIQGRTGQSVSDILNKKFSFKKNTTVNKKLEEVMPVVRELRAVGYHLQSQNEKLDLDSKQWKSYSEKVEQDLALKENEWSKQQDEVEKDIAELKVMLDKAEDTNNNLQKDVQRAELQIKAKESELEFKQESLKRCNEELLHVNKSLAEKDAKIHELEDLVLQSQRYSATLQTYNTNLQNEINNEKSKRDELQISRDTLQSKIAEQAGLLKSLEQVLQFEKDQVQKLRDERESAARDLAMLRIDIDTMRQDRDRALTEVERLKADVDRVRTAGGKSLETLETLNNDNATMQVQLSTQHKLITSMREELAMSKEQRALAESMVDSKGMQMSEMKAQIASLQESLADAEKRVFEGESIRRKLHNIIQELKGNIRVFCRVRPMSSDEMAHNGEDGSMAVDFPQTNDILGKAVAVTVPSSSANQPPQRHQFTFDKVFGPTSTQGEVFEEISELVQSALDGHKVCIFAYGQTGSGKTYTMLGSPSAPGMIPQAMEQIFETSRKLGEQGWSFSMQASMLEIYNEEYKDLLSKKKTDGKKHQVAHDTNGNTTVSDLTHIDVSNSERVQSLLADAMEKRSVGCTLLNEHSSRSHMVFTLKIDGFNSSSEAKIQGVLNLIDLAGSERVKESGATGARLKEAQSINKSLSSLGDVIVALANKQEHIPFRNSKLTYLLQSCLGGDAKTLMFVNTAPSREFSSETLCSLRFAQKVNICEINPKRNIRV